MMAMICFDLDGVLADFHRAFLEFLNEELGTDYKPTDIKDYSLTRVIPNFTHQDYEHYFLKFMYSGGFATLPLTRQHYENTLFAMLQDGNEVCYITSRPIEARNDTVKWLAVHGLPISHLIFTHDKASAALQLNVDVMIEDNGDNIRNLMTNGVQCILISKPYNLGVTIPGVPRVHTSKQLYTTIYKINRYKVEV